MISFLRFIVTDWGVYFIVYGIFLQKFLLVTIRDDVKIWIGSSQHNSLSVDEKKFIRVNFHGTCLVAPQNGYFLVVTRNKMVICFKAFCMCLPVLRSLQNKIGTICHYE